MKNIDILQTIFLAFVIAIFLKLFEVIFNFYLKGFWLTIGYWGVVVFLYDVISFIILIISSVVGYYPNIINLKSKNWEVLIIRIAKKISFWSFIIWIILTFIIGFWSYIIS